MHLIFFEYQKYQNAINIIFLIKHILDSRVCLCATVTDFF